MNTLPTGTSPQSESFPPDRIAPLSQMKTGQRGRICRLIEGTGISQRLLEMGLTTGAEITVIHFAPMGAPIDIKVRGYHLSLRRQEAELIQVKLF